jgi:hypothetical protein
MESSSTSTPCPLAVVLRCDRPGLCHRVGHETVGLFTVAFGILRAVLSGPGRPFGDGHRPPFALLRTDGQLE